MSRTAKRFIRFGANGPFIFPYRVPRVKDQDEGGRVLVWCEHNPECWTFIKVSNLVVGEIWRPAPKRPATTLIQHATNVRKQVRSDAESI